MINTVLKKNYLPKSEQIESSNNENGVELGLDLVAVGWGWLVGENIFVRTNRIYSNAPNTKQDLNRN